MRDNRPSGSEGGVESHISIPTPIYSNPNPRRFKPRRGGMVLFDRETAAQSKPDMPPLRGL